MPAELELAGVLKAAESDELAAVYLLDPSRRTATLSGLRAFTSSTPAGWVAGRHYLKAPAPVLRYTSPAGREVRVMRAAQWFGEGSYPAEAADAAWRELDELLGELFDAGRLLETPASTGRYLLLRSIAFGREWPVLEPEVQELIRSTSGQARREVIDRGGHGALVEYDGRFMYGALVRELGAGEPELDAVNEFAGHRRGRYLVRATVPLDWSTWCTCGAPGHDRIGILPYAERDGSWSWPAEPGRVFASWCDGAELSIAYAHGWRVAIQERLLYPWPPYPPLERASGQREKRGPLDAWAERLIAAYGGHRWAASSLTRTALRRLVLHTIGALHGRGHAITHTTPIDDAASIPAHVDPSSVERVDDVIVWAADEAAAWPEMSHPEWSSAVWARARAALLSRNGTGALHVPAAHVVGFDTDALYLCRAPAWTDNGRAGVLRRVRAWAEVELPHSIVDIYNLKRSQS